MEPYKTAAEGWIYCIVNFRDRDMVKIGMTSRSMESRMKDANGSFTTDGFYIVVAKHVRKPYEREQAIHKILGQYRVTTNREFFDVRVPGVFDNVLRIFELMDGDVHPESKFRLDYMPRRARAPSASASPSPPKQLSEFSRIFWELFRRSADARRTVPVDTVETMLAERGFGDVTVDMQNLGFYPYEDARHQMVFRGLERAVGTIDFDAFRYMAE